MRSRLIALALTGALLVASGVHLALLQAFAWASMAAANLSSHAPIQAVARALDGKRPCRLCLSVRKAAGRDQQSIASRTESRLDVISVAPVVLPFVRIALPAEPAAPGRITQVVEEFAVPPPRSLPATLA